MFYYLNTLHGVRCEVRTHALLREFEDLKGVIIIADDILVYGEGDTDELAKEDHEQNLKQLLERCLERNIKLNRQKMKLRLKEVRYIGHVISSDGIKPDPSKVETIVIMPAPENVKQLKHFLGMINYISKFIPTASKISESLR